jgi:hypothetical protein
MIVAAPEIRDLLLEWATKSWFAESSPSSIQVSILAAEAIGYAAQLNPRAQQLLLRAGTVRRLLESLSRTQESVILGRRRLFALSSLVRSSRVGAQAFLDEKGLQTLLAIVEGWGMQNESGAAIKAIALVADMALLDMTEGWHLNATSVSERGEEASVGSIQSWCRTLLHLVRANSGNGPDAAESRGLVAEAANAIAVLLGHQSGDDEERVHQTSLSCRPLLSDGDALVVGQVLGPLL